MQSQHEFPVGFHQSQAFTTTTLSLPKEETYCDNIIMLQIQTAVNSVGSRQTKSGGMTGFLKARVFEDFLTIIQTRFGLCLVSHTRHPATMIR